MVMKPEYILNLEKTEQVFSVMKFHKFESSAIKFFDEKKYQRVYEEGQVKQSGKAKWTEVIFKTPQPFYLHFINDVDDDELYWLNIYYKSENRNELFYFTNQTLKNLKDGTDNNRTITTENK